MQAADLPVAAIQVGERLRGVEASLVVKLLESMARIGLTHRILVGPDHTLIDGLQRLEAAKELGWETVPVDILSAPEIERQVAAIDANLIRKGYRGPALGQALKLQKELYLALYPETGHGGDRRSKAHAALLKQGRAPSFITVTAKKLGVDPATVKRQVQIATAFAADELATLAALGVPQTQMLELARQEPAARRAGVERLQREANAVDEVEEEAVEVGVGRKGATALPAPVKAPRRNGPASRNGPPSRNGKDLSRKSAPGPPSGPPGGWLVPAHAPEAGRQLARHFAYPDDLIALVMAWLEESGTPCEDFLIEFTTAWDPQEPRLAEALKPVARLLFELVA